MCRLQDLVDGGRGWCITGVGAAGLVEGAEGRQGKVELRRDVDLAGDSATQWAWNLA